MESTLRRRHAQRANMSDIKEKYITSLTTLMLLDKIFQLKNNNKINSLKIKALSYSKKRKSFKTDFFHNFINIVQTGDYEEIKVGSLFIANHFLWVRYFTNSIQNSIMVHCFHDFEIVKYFPTNVEEWTLLLIKTRTLFA